MTSLGKMDNLDLATSPSAPMLACSLIITLAIVTAPPDVQTSPVDGSEGDLLELLLQHNDISRSRVEAIDYTFRFESHTYLSSMGPMESEGDGHIIIDRAARWNELHRTTHGERDGEAIIYESLSRWVLNDRYFALWRGGVSAIQMFDRPSSDALPDHARMMMQGERGPNILLYGFGTGEVPLRDFVKPRTAGWVWTARKISDSASTEFELLCYVEGHPKTPSAMIRLDPNQGFLVTRVAIYASDGRLGLNREIHNERLAEDVWLPNRVMETRYLSMLGDELVTKAANMPDGALPEREEGTVVQESSFEIVSVKLQGTVPSSTFELVSLQAP